MKEEIAIPSSIFLIDTQGYKGQERSLMFFADAEDFVGIEDIVSKITKACVHSQVKVRENS
ncbi:hypothetical protein [Bacillus cihuensis]|uniref:hypothetical protein n=1 Tax=Bacillus cihuensis TaxID=1208599 RepID=UPI0003F97D54|nr:hypothetical protein [Bacillus cihuensis]